MNTITPYIYSQKSLTFEALPIGYTNVDKYLIRGPHPSVKDLLKLKKEGVNQIYDFRHLSNFGCKFIEKLFCRVTGIKYTRLPYSNLYGEYPDLRTFENVASKVKENGKNGGLTLFHCNSGCHRTSHFSAFYSLTQGEPLELIQKKYKNKYKSLISKIIEEQIINKNYFNRNKKEYNGRNPIKKIRAAYNNKIVDGLINAHKQFQELVFIKEYNI